MPFENRELDKLTDEAINDPQVGDRFSEMFTFWLYVVEVGNGLISTIEASAPCTLPRDGEFRVQTLKEFRERLSYGSIPGYWVRLVDRGNNVENWV